MKKLFVLFFVLLTLAINAQDVKYELYKCSATQYHSSESEWSESQETDFIIRICPDRIEFNNNISSIFYISELVSTRTGFDKDNDKFTRKVWNGYDEEGLKCHLISIDYTNLPNRNFILQYQDGEVLFQCNIISKRANESTTINPTKL